MAHSSAGTRLQIEYKAILKKYFQNKFLHSCLARLVNLMAQFVDTLDGIVNITFHQFFFFFDKNIVQLKEINNIYVS